MPKALNSESVRVNLQFTADTAQAKKELKQLQDTLRSLTTNPAGGQTLSKEMAEASRYAAELSVHLKKATNPNSGMLDFSRLNESIKKSGMSLSAYGDKLLSLGPQGKQAFSQLATAVAQSEIPIRRVNGTLAQMGTVLKNTIRWQLSSTAIHAFSGAIQTAYNYAKDLNESLNNIRIVTGYNIDQMEQFAQTANKAARALSTSTLDYTNAALIYYQQGLSDKEVEARTNVTAKMANVTKQSAEEVSNQLTAIWNNYAKGSENLEYFADVITALGAATASSSKEISTGLEKFAAIGETVGLSYEYATAALATVTATTRQSAEVVGNSFKTLFSRIQGLKLGETQDDGTDLNKYSAALMSVGVNIKDASGQLKDMDIILEETAAKWKTLGREQQMALAQTVGGVRQYTQFIALMDNWDFMQKNLQTAYGSSGSLQKQQDIYAESWEAAAKRVKAAWEDVYKSLINDEFFIDLLNFVEKAVTGFKNLIGAMGGIPGILTTIGSLVMTIFGKQMAESLTNMTYSIQSLTTHGRQKMIDERQAQLNRMGDAAVSQADQSQASQAWANNLRTQINLQDQLAANAEKLGNTERFVASALMDQVQYRSKLVEEAAKEVDKAALKETDELIGQKALAKEEYEKKHPGKIFDENKFMATYHSYKNAILKEISADGKEIQAKFNSLIMPEAGGKDYVNNARSYIKNVMNAFGEEIKKSNVTLYRSMEQAGGKSAKELEKMLPQIDDELKNLEVRTEGTALHTQEMGISFEAAGGMAEPMGNAIREAAGSTQILTTRQQELAQAVEQVNLFIVTATQQTMTWQQQLVSFASIAMSAGMIFNSLNGIIDTWKNKDLTFGEKFFSSLTSLGMIIPMAIKGLSALKASMASIRVEEQMAVLAATQHMDIDELRITLGKARLILNQTELNNEQKLNALKALGLNIEKLENGELEKGTILQKIFNAETWKNPYVIAGAAILAVFIGIAVALKQAAAAEKERAAAAKEALDNQANKYIEETNAIKEESKALGDLTDALISANNAYLEGKGSKEDLQRAGYDLVKQYDIENGALLVLQGDYDTLIQKIKQYRAEKAKEDAQNINDNSAYFDKNGVFLNNIVSEDKNYASTKWGTGGAQHTGEGGQYYTALQQYGLVKDLNNGWADYSVDFSNLNRTDFIAQYDAIQKAINDIIKINPSSKLKDYYQEILDEYKVAYDEAKTDLDTLIKLKDIELGNNFDSSKYKQNLQDTATAIKDLTNAISNEANNPNSPYYNLTPTEQEQKAIELLQEIHGWDNTKILEYQVITEFVTNHSGVDFNDVAKAYEELPNEAHKRIYLQLIAEGINPSSELGQQLFNKRLNESQLELYTTNVSGLTTARDKFKKGMSSAELDKWAKDSGVNWGEDGELGIDKNNFLALSDIGREQWLYQQQYKNREQAYKIANEITNEQPIQLTDEQQDFANRMINLMRQGGYTDVSQLESTWAKSGGDMEQFAVFKQWLNQSNNKEAATTYTSDENARRANEFASSMETISGLKQGDKISTEELEQMKSSIGESLGEYFVQDGNGKWQLVIDGVDFHEEVENNLSEKIAQKSQGGTFTKEQQVQIVNYANSLAKLEKYTRDYNIDADISKKRMVALATQYPQLSKQVKNYTRVLNDATASEEDQAHAEHELRRELKKAEWDQVISDIEKYVKTLNNSKATNKEIRQANQEIANSFREMFNVAVDADWVATHKELFEELYNADAEFVNDVALKIQTLMALEEAEVNGVLDDIGIGYDQLKSIIEANPITVDAEGNADMSNLIQGLVDAGVTAEGVAAILRAIGQTNVTISTFGNAGDFDLSTLEGMQAFAEQLKQNITASGTVPSITGAGGHDLTEKLGGGSGGGGGSKPKSEAQKQEEERYHYETELLEDLEKATDRAAKAKDRLFGNHRAKAIGKEIQALEKEIEAQKKLIKEVERYKELDLNTLLFGKEKAFQVQDAEGNYVWKNLKGIQELIDEFPEKADKLTPIIDEFGNIENWDDIKQTVLDILNADIEAFNIIGDIHYQDAEYLALAKAQYEEFVKVLEQFEETMNKLRDEQDKLIDMQYEKQDLYEEQLRTQIEYRIQLEKNEIKMLESMMRTMESNFYKSVEVASLMNDKFLKTLEYSKNLQGDYDTWVNAHSSGQISDEAFAEHMQEIFDQAGDSIEDIMAQWESMSTYYSEVLDQFDERLKLETRVFGNLIDELEYYNELLALSGHEQDYDKQLEIIRGEQDILKDRLVVDKETQRFYQEQYDQFRAAYDAALAEGDTDKAEFLLPSLQAAADKLDEMSAQVRDDVKQIAELAQKEFSTTLDKIYHEAEQKLTNGLGFDYLSQTMDLASKRAEEYLTKTNQIYETSQLLRKINQDMDKTDNVAAKTKLNNFSKEIQALQEKGELSHYELEDAKARYEVLKAQIALEEAQNAKSTVRLQRDNEGNFGYVYTADRAAIDDAEAQFEQAQNDRYNLALETQQEYLRKYYDTEREAQEALRQLDEDFAAGRIESEEEYQRRRQEIIEYYSELLQTYEDINTQAIAVMHEVAAEHVNDSWTATFGDEEGYGLIGKADQWREVTVTDTELVDDALRVLTDTLQTVVEPEYDNLTERINIAREASEKLKNQLIDNFLPQMEGVVQGVASMTLAWSEYTAQLREALAALMALQAAAQAQLASVGGASSLNLDADYSLRASQAYAEGRYGDITTEMGFRSEKMDVLGLEDTYESNQRIQHVLDDAMSGDKKADELINRVVRGEAFYTDEELKKYGYKTGGYTGAWGNSGKLAMLHEKELVLNQDDTKNMLATVEVVRKLSDMIDLQAIGARESARTGGSLDPIGMSTLEQTITIYADFPNATQYNEIEMAFDNIINKASQYAHRA